MKPTKKTITIKLTEEEFDFVMEIAKKTKLSVSKLFVIAVIALKIPAGCSIDIS